VLGATDARHYHAICDQVYRFTPLAMKETDVRRVHGLNERVGVEAMGRMVQFYHQLIQAWGADPAREQPN
jgi:carboxypeptidase PM20D1